MAVTLQMIGGGGGRASICSGMVPMVELFRGSSGRSEGVCVLMLTDLVAAIPILPMRESSFW